MRPQRFAADHRFGGAGTGASLMLASMRPQRFAADHEKLPLVTAPGAVASMRPQRFAADHFSELLFTAIVGIMLQ